MNKPFNLILFCLLVISIFSTCETEVNISADWKDITVIHGFINEGFGCVVRIRKTFNGDQNAFEMSKIADSSNYREPVEVYMQEIFKEFTTEYPMVRYDYPKDSGLFPQSNNYWWFGEPYIDSRKQYQIIVYFPNRDKYVSAKTHIIPKASIMRPSRTTKYLYFTEDYPFTLVFQSKDFGEFYQFKIRFNYVDYYNDLTRKDNFIEWDLEPIIISPAPLPDELKEIYKKKLSYEAIYGFLASHISEDSSILYRELSGIDIRLFIGTHEYNLYYNEGKGLEFGNERKKFTNVVNGTGIFTSIAVTELKGLVPDQSSLDSLAYGQITGKLGFKNTLYPYD